MTRIFSPFIANHLPKSLGKRLALKSSRNVVWNSYDLNNPIRLSNQDVQTDNFEHLHDLQKQFQVDGLSYSFGYGSGVLKQLGYEKIGIKPQVDMIHVVQEPAEFHARNYSKFPNHYSSLMSLGLPAVIRAQKWGAGVYFNPYVTMQDSLGNETIVKYGIVSKDIALRDIGDWSSLYVAGRLQKPVLHLHNLDNDLKSKNQYNLDSAFHLALLLMVKKNRGQLVNIGQIFEQIASISYMGDPRMFVGGENPNKVKNIVSKQMHHFEKLYEVAIDRARSNGILRKSKDLYEINVTKFSIASILGELPIVFRSRLLHSYKKKYFKELLNCPHVSSFVQDSTWTVSYPQTELIDRYLLAVSTDRNLRRTLLTTVSGIIAYPALIQSLKGIFTAGLVKSAKYAWEKKLKSIKN